MIALLSQVVVVLAMIALDRLECSGMTMTSKVRICHVERFKGDAAGRVAELFFCQGGENTLSA